MKEIKDYLHLYLGCEVAVPSIANIEDWEDYFLLSVSIHNCIIIHAEHGISTFKHEQVKPILRPLSSMTEDEKKEIGFAAFEVLRKDEFDNKRLPPRNISCMWAARQTVFLLSKHFDLFGLIESGLAIDATKIQADIK